MTFKLFSRFVSIHNFFCMLKSARSTTTMKCRLRAFCSFYSPNVMWLDWIVELMMRRIICTATFPIRNSWKCSADLCWNQYGIRIRTVRLCSILSAHIKLFHIDKFRINFRKKTLHKGIFFRLLFSFHRFSRCKSLRKC